MNRLHVQVISQEKPLLDDIADIALIPGAAGQLGILSGHTPLMTKLQAGIVTIRQGSKDVQIAISGGFATMEPDNTLTILADTATKAEDISLKEAEAAKKRAEDKMKQADTISAREFKIAEGQLRKALVELQVARKRKSISHMP